MSVAHKLRDFAWKHNAGWREVIIIAAAIVFVVALIGTAAGW